MTRCTSEGCDMPVMVVYHWPGKVGDLHACAICAMKLENISQAMSHPFDARHMTFDEQLAAWDSREEGARDE